MRAKTSAAASVRAALVLSWFARSTEPVLPVAVDIRFDQPVPVIGSALSALEPTTRWFRIWGAGALVVGAAVVGAAVVGAAVVGAAVVGAAVVGAAVGAAVVGAGSSGRGRSGRGRSGWPWARR